MKLIIKIISIAIIILTLSDQLAGQDTTNTTTPTTTNSTDNATSTNTTTNSTTNNTTNNTTQPETPVKPVAPVKVETDPYKLYLCDEKNASSISIVNLFFVFLNRRKTISIGLEDLFLASFSFLNSFINLNKGSKCDYMYSLLRKKI